MERPQAQAEVEEGRREAEPSELRLLHREIAEAHAVASRTHNAVAILGASLKEVIARQDRYERGLNLNSFVAYAIFTILLAGGFSLLYRARAGRLVMDRDQATRQRDAAVAEAETVRAKLAVREQAEEKALGFWQLLDEGKKAEALASYPDVVREPLSVVEALVFQRAVGRARAEIVDAGFAEGLEAFRAVQWKRASGALKRALAYEEEGPRAAQIRYYYGVTLHKQGDYAEAARELELSIAGGAERTIGPDARFYLASAFELLRQTDRARTEYEKFASTRPTHPFAGVARRKASEISARTAKAP